METSPYEQDVPRLSDAERVKLVNASVAEWNGSKSLQRGCTLRTYVDGILIEAGQPRVSDDEYAAASGPVDGPFADRASSINRLGAEYDRDPNVARVSNQTRAAYISGSLIASGCEGLTESERGRVYAHGGGVPVARSTVASVNSSRATVSVAGRPGDTPPILASSNRERHIAVTPRG